MWLCQGGRQGLKASAVPTSSKELKSQSHLHVCPCLHPHPPKAGGFLDSLDPDLLGITRIHNHPLRTFIFSHLQSTSPSILPKHLTTSHSDFLNSLSMSLWSKAIHDTSPPNSTSISAIVPRANCVPSGLHSCSFSSARNRLSFFST